MWNWLKSEARYHTAKASTQIKGRIGTFCPRKWKNDGKWHDGKHICNKLKYHRGRCVCACGIKRGA